MLCIILYHVSRCLYHACITLSASLCVPLYHACIILCNSVSLSSALCDAVSTGLTYTLASRYTAPPVSQGPNRSQLCKWRSEVVLGLNSEDITSVKGNKQTTPIANYMTLRITRQLALHTTLLGVNHWLNVPFPTVAVLTARGLGLAPRYFGV